jgi:hypothetical protein
MRLEDLDFTALINQMWGSEANLHSFLDTEVPHLCARICGPEAPVPMVKVIYPQLKGEVQEGVDRQSAIANTIYQGESDGVPATILIHVIIAGNKSKLPQFIARELVHHWEALGAIGETRFDYPESVAALVKKSDTPISEERFKEIYSPQFIAKAITVARDLEIPLQDFLFPRMSLSIYMPRPEDGTADSN